MCEGVVNGQFECAVYECIVIEQMSALCASSLQVGKGSALSMNWLRVENTSAFYECSTGECRVRVRPSLLWRGF